MLSSREIQNDSKAMRNLKMYPETWGQTIS